MHAVKSKLIFQQHQFLLLWSVLLLLCVNRADANERKFSYVYETSVLPPGVRELEIWNTYRTDRWYFYRRLDQRVEYEFGVAQNLMSAFYLNSSWRMGDSNGSADSGDAVHSQEVSISSEWKYKIFDRTADPVGLALYGEATMGLNEFEIEGKILLDKQINDFLFAFNAVAEKEWETELENGIATTESELTLEFDMGASYQVNHSLSVGLEIRSHNLIKEGDWEHSALFAGPVVSFSTETWCAALTVLPQVTSFKGATQDGLVLDGLEKVESRLLFTFHL